MPISGFVTISCFNTQPPEGGWAAPYGKQVAKLVSTHSRPKAAGGNKHGLF